MLRFASLILVILWLAAGCGSREPVLVAAHSCDELAGLVDQDEELTIDRQDKFEGEGALYVKASEKRAVRLLELENPELEDVLITCTAQAKCIGIWGRAYLELFCSVPGEGDFTARDWDHAVHATQDWTPVRVEYRLEDGQRPDRLRLSLVINSAGSVWLDDIRITATPLP
jgi:hypothetical protein